MRNPYKSLSDRAFWRGAVSDPAPILPNIYRKRFEIGSDDLIATAGSCFAQHITRQLRERGYRVMDLEPAPGALPRTMHESFGFSMYSARYGNIYTVQQLLQLAREAFGVVSPRPAAWERNGRYFDAFRPGVEPDGLNDPAEVAFHRERHLRFVRAMFKRMDIFVFTLGLTEHWAAKENNVVYPMAPGTIAGDCDPAVYEFRNAGFNEVVRDFRAFDALLQRRRRSKPLRYILTVSPVPLTATCTDHHVLSATAYSKAVLRAAAGALYDAMENIDYFPSFEIVTNPGARSANFARNLRSVEPAAVERVMDVFFAEHGGGHCLEPPEIAVHDPEMGPEDFVKCEEQILEAFHAR